ncbi:MAG TPA: nuclear transport factor 2 family protein [Steroidobacteraceae bacterium]|nr:nuclear transport factor 2 family protein [Steroidobacteraceae bacterium]
MTPRDTLIDLEMKFWQSMVDGDADTTTELLGDTALMVSSHGAIQFDHDGYRKMAEQGPNVVTDFELSDVNVLFPNDSTAILTYHVKQTVAQRGKAKGSVQEVNDTSTWVKSDDRWRCVAHTETPSQATRSRH